MTDEPHALEAAPQVDRNDRPRLWIENITFSGGQKITLDKSDVIVFVGPNNSGKTAALQQIYSHIQAPQHATKTVLSELTIGQSFTPDEFEEWVKGNLREAPDGQFFFGQQKARLNDAKFVWANLKLNGIQGIWPGFISLAFTAERITAVQPPKTINLVHHVPNHPIQHLYRDGVLEERFSELFHQAFGQDLIVHRGAGDNIPLYCGVRPVFENGEDRVSESYVSKIEKLNSLIEQGDGVRSFVGVLLHALIGDRDLVEIDEPEAFLHPPQARLLGRMLVQQKPPCQQLVVATHSSDFLHGIIDAGGANVHVMRITREGDANFVSELSQADLKEIWADPLLRYSKILDGLFYDSVIVCEADSDCRFYQATSDALAANTGEQSSPDILFTHCGGKDRIPSVVSSLRALNVPVRVVVDFDVFRETSLVERLVRNLGGDWDGVEDDCKLIERSISEKRPDLVVEEVRKEIEQILNDEGTASLSKSAVSKIGKVLRKSSPWSLAKDNGVNYVPAGDPTNAYVRVDQHLRSVGIYVVSMGELENFDRTVPGHGPKWVNGVLQKDILNDPDLEEARRFVGALVSE